jgi:hypothetical protein
MKKEKKKNNEMQKVFCRSLSALLRLTAFDYPFGIFKHFLLRKIKIKQHEPDIKTEGELKCSGRIIGA